MIACLIVAAILLVAFWALWWGDRSLIASRRTRSYYEFEGAFALADGWLLITVLAAALTLWRASASALLWLVAAGSAGLYLLGMDALYDLRNGIYASGRGGVIELAIDLLTGSASVAVLCWSWRERARLLGS